MSGFVGEYGNPFTRSSLRIFFVYYRTLQRRAEKLQLSEADAEELTIAGLRMDGIVDLEDDARTQTQLHAIKTAYSHPLNRTAPGQIYG